MTHPSLGLPPIDRSSPLPPAAARVHASRERLAARALETALDRDPTMRERYDDVQVRRLLRDTLALTDRIVETLADGNTDRAWAFAEAAPPIYRRRRVPMNDLITLANAVRAAVGAIMPRADLPLVDLGIDTMIDRFKWHGRIAGDAKKRNRLIAAIYKGA